ncbi:MAG: hypothetical protein IPK15_00950 [Verrucomicrobia bacterium]|nr:hypothetical protein [Verrucomicrobiota bacterium]
MRTLPLTVILIVATAFSTMAQLVVEVVVDQEQFLRDEAVTVKVRVTNRSGQTLRLGADNDWLGFAIEGVDSGSVSRLAEVPVKGEFLLESAHMATRTVDLAPCFDLSQPGRYNITATVRIKEWGTETASKPRRIEVVRGTKLWEQEFGVPAVSGVPETRRYVLQQANYKKQLMLFLRLTDFDDHRVFRVAPLGPMVSFSQPEAQVDRKSELNVLFQTGARSFLFYVIRPDGEVAIRQTYDYAGSRPSLRLTEEGRIFVGGGARRPTANDIPTPLAATTVTTATTPDTAATNRPTADVPKPDGKSKKK